MKIAIIIGCGVVLVGLGMVHGESLAEPRPQLQVINGSDEPADVFWLEPGGGRVSNGGVDPGDDTVIGTTLGHRFVVVGRESRTEQKVTSEALVQGFRFDPQATDGVPEFYSQRLDAAGGFPVVASETVSPFALKEAVFLIDQMFAKRPDVRDAVVRSGARLCIIAHDEFTTDLPEFERLGTGGNDPFIGVSSKDFWDARARGTGGSKTDPYCSCGEENLLGYPGDPYAEENILIHEFAHCIHLRGMSNIDPSFDGRLRETYDRAMAAGLWKGKYASVNHHEYFAEGVQSWFDDNREDDHDHNHVNTRVELVAYDPGLAEICREVFGDTELSYTKPVTRLGGHLEGYDPAAAPTFRWPNRLQRAKTLIRKQAEARQ